MKTWKFLKTGDLVDVIAPGSATSREELQEALEFLKSWGLRYRVREPLFSGHPYVASDPKKRLTDLKQALLAKDSKAVWCLRGGYGAIQLVPELLKIKPPSQSLGKILLGYSDVSTLHLWLTQKWKWISCHGPLLDGMGKKKYDEKDIRELFNILFGVQNEITFDGLIPRNKAALRVRTIEAPLIAGNLMVLASSFGTGLELKTRGKILCLEEIGERGYRVDRLLWQLQQSKAMAGCQAILLGDFLGGLEPGGNSGVKSGVETSGHPSNFVSLALEEFVERQEIPIFSGLQIGHGPVNRPLFLGPRAVLSRKTKTSAATLYVGSGGVF